MRFPFELESADMIIGLPPTFPNESAADLTQIKRRSEKALGKNYDLRLSGQNLRRTPATASVKQRSHLN